MSNRGLTIQLEALPSTGAQPGYLEGLIRQIWPHRSQEIFGLFVNGGSEIDATTDHPFVITSDGKPIGITGFYKYDDRDVGLCWHGIIPAHRGQGASRSAFSKICTLAAEKYQTATEIIELVPSDREGVLAPYFCRLGFSHHGEVATFDYLPKGPAWLVYRAPLHDARVEEASVLV